MRRLVVALALVAFSGCSESAPVACVPGSEGCECNMGKCLTGLVCLSNLCVDPSTGGTGGTGGVGGNGGVGGLGGDAGSGGVGGAGGFGGAGDGFPCTEQGIRDAIAEGGGPHTFNCSGPQTVVTQAEIEIDNDVILDGERKLTVDGANGHRVFSVELDVTAELRRLTVTRGSAPAGSGGGVINDGTLTLADCTVTDSSALRFGGGVANFGTMTMAESRVSGNSAGEDGGGVFNSLALTMTDSTIADNIASLSGGGVGNSGSGLVMTGCTVSDNQSSQNGGGVVNSNLLTIANSTLSGNTASVDGGGIRNDSVMTILHATFSGNTAATGSAIGNSGVVMTMSGTLIEGDCTGTAIGSVGYNIESPGDSCGLDQTGDRTGVLTPGIEPLADNGGPTMTHALLNSSVAIDAIPDASCDVDTDQRGEARDTMCDVGAFEVQP